MSAGRKGKGTGAASSQWKGGRYIAKGYVWIMVSTLPPEVQAMAARMTPKPYILEHRIAAAMALTRPLLPGEVVHRVKDDNRPENLLVTSTADHSIAHRDVEKELLALREEVAALRAENAALRSPKV